MTVFLNTCVTFLQSGFVFALIAMGYYISYTILDFPDMTVEGTFLSGAVAYGLCVAHGINPWLGLILAFLVGFLFGTITGILHVKLKIKPLLCGILVSTVLISLNLVGVTAGLYGDFTGESSAMIPFGRDYETLTAVFPINLIPNKIGVVSGMRDLVLFLVMALVFKLLLDAFLKTKCGLLLRAAGDNAQFVTTQAKDAGNSKILGLGIGNAYAAVAGALYTEIFGNVNQSMGLGMVVIGLASLIIGVSVFSRVHFLKSTTKVIFGAIIYQACLTIAQRLGMPSAYNKLIMAIIFTIALVLSERKKTKAKALRHPEGKEKTHA